MDYWWVRVRVRGNGEMRNEKHMTLEELLLEREQCEERLQENPLDSSTISRYNYLTELINKREKYLYEEDRLSP